MEEIDKYSKEQAENLLKNIEMIADIRKLKVPKPDSNEMEMFTLQEWVQWLFKRVNEYGSFGIEEEFLAIIGKIDANNKIVTERAKEAVRRLLSVLEVQDKLIEQLKKLQPQQVMKGEISYMNEYDLDKEEFEKKEVKKEETDETKSVDVKEVEKQKRRGGLFVPDEYNNLKR